MTPAKVTIVLNRLSTIVLYKKIKIPLTRRGSPSAVVNVSATSVRTGLKLQVSYISFNSRDTDEPVSMSMFVLTPRSQHSQTNNS